MKKVEISAFEDPAHPAGGYAVICLHGLTTISEHATFLLKPVDIVEGNSEFERWPHGTHTPIETRVTADGVELVIGPDLIDNPVLLPGTTVRIDLPGEAVAGDFLWPNVSPMVRPRRKSVFANRRLGDATAPPATILSADAPVPARPIVRTALRDAEPESVPATRAAGAPPADVAPPAVFYASARRGLVGDGAAPSAVAVTRTRSLSDFIPQSRQGVAALAVAALLAVQAATYLLFWPRAVRETSAPSALAAGTGAPGPNSIALYDALQTGATSPRGVSAAGVMPQKSLELANSSLFGAGGQRDSDEAAFWMKRYLAGSVGDERVRRVLTQLGTTYAQPSRGTPAYATAQQVWEIAAAFGDPQAMCFIAVLYDRGLAGPSLPAVSSVWMRRATDAGGCAKADAAKPAVP